MGVLTSRCLHRVHDFCLYSSCLHSPSRIMATRRHSAPLGPDVMFVAFSASCHDGMLSLTFYAVPKNQKVPLWGVTATRRAKGELGIEHGSRTWVRRTNKRDGAGYVASATIRASWGNMTERRDGLPPNFARAATREWSDGGRRSRYWPSWMTVRSQYPSNLIRAAKKRYLNPRARPAFYRWRDGGRGCRCAQHAP